VPSNRLAPFLECVDEIRNCEQLAHVLLDNEQGRSTRGELTQMPIHRVNQRSEQFTEALYRGLCGRVVVPGAELAEHPGALLALAGGDTKFLRTIAALGCVGSPIVNSESIAKCCEQQGLSSEDFMTRAQAIETKHKFRFLIPVGRYWALTV
jgi:hypothetical protein